MEEGDANSIMCGLCSFECVKYKRLRRHYRKEHPECELLSCPFCDFVTSDQKVVSRHKKVEHRQDRISCSCCDFSTKSWRKWAQHKDTVHQSAETEGVQTQHESYSQIAEYSSEAHNGSASPSHKRCKINLSSHEVEDTAIQSEGEGLSSSRTDKAAKLDSDSGSLFSDQSQQEKSITNHKCSTCGKMYTSVRRLSRHQLKHTGSPCANIPPFYCNLCNTTFTKKSSLTYHQRLHEGSRPFKCQFCDYATSKKSTLDQHLNSHSRTKPYKCNICDYATTFRSNLLYHKVKHSDDRPFACELCTKAFKRKDHLQTHIRTRHELKL